MCDENLVQLAPFSFSENGITHERFATQFDSGWSGTQSQRAIVEIPTVESNQRWFVCVVDENGHPFRTKFISDLSNTLIGLINGANQFN
jgi:hypothetical protein